MKNKNTDKDIEDHVLIIYNSVEHFIDFFKKRNIIVRRLYKKVSYPLIIIRRLFKFAGLGETYWYDDWKDLLETTKILIAFAPLKLNVIKFIIKNNRNIRIIYWYWNPVFRIGLPEEKLSNFAELWSFDPKDCRVYNMKFNTTFYFKDISLPANEIEYDAIFLGINKGRRDFLRQLENRLNKNGIKTYFHIVPDKHEIYKNKSTAIPYSKYLEMVSKTRAIVDITPSGQSGITLRPMESIFLKKKLITNSSSIVSQDFYNKQNIFIIGQDDERNLREFIDSPYLELENFVIDKYDFNNWLDRFHV